MRTFFASLMVICSMVLMQIHSIDFWMEKAGPSGWAWSIGLEVAMLWFWYENKRRLKVFKYLAAFLLIAGPWYQITAPTFENLNSVKVMQAEIETAQDAVTQLSTSLDRYEKRSDKRSGWAGRIDKTQAQLQEARTYLSILRGKGVNHDASWRSSAVAGMQAAALLIILTAQLAAVTSLRCRNVTTATKTVTAKRNVTRNGNGHTVTVEPLPERYEETVATVAAEITSRVAEFGSQAKLCRQTGLRPEYVTAVMNHEEKKKTGGAITPNGLKKVADALGVTV
jgi:hypothetical protein